MKAYVLHGINELRFEEKKIPVPRKDEVLIKVCAAGICGSDIPRIYKNGAHIHPIIPGHEFAGIVESVGDSKNDNLIGKRMGIFPLIPCQNCRQCKEKKYEMCRNYNYLGSRCDGAFAEYVSVPIWNLIELPDSVSFAEAAMLEPLSVAAHSMRAMIGEKTDRDIPVLVLGVGTIGMMLVMLLKSEGFKNIFCIASKSYQAQVLSEKMGIDKDNIFEGTEKEKVLEWCKERTGDGAVISFECVGKNETFSTVIECMAPSGKVMLVGNPASEMSLSREVYWKILRNQLTVKGTWNSSFTKEDNDDWHYILNKLSEHAIPAEILISHRFDLENLIKGFELMRDKSENYIKCMYIIKS